MGIKNLTLKVKNKNKRFLNSSKNRKSSKKSIISFCNKLKNLKNN